MKVTELLKQATDAKKTRFAFELLPPLKGENISTIFSAIEPLRPFDPA